MKALKKGKRFPLLFYRRTMGRLSIHAFLFGLLCAIIWDWSVFKEIPILNINNDIWFFMGWIVSFSVSVIAYLSSKIAYVQVHQNYISLVTPFFHINTSFQRIKNIHPALIQQLFPLKESNWSRRSFLEPFFGKTAIVVELSSYPLAPSIIKLFFPQEIFSTQSNGFVILVKEWMQLSTEFDSSFGAWLQLHGRSSAKNH